VELTKFSSAKVQGFILDLRFANGHDYDAARAVAGRFLSDGQKLFAVKRAGGNLEMFQAKRSDDAEARKKWQEEPLIILINAETRGSAEVVAGALRSQNRGILIGHATAGSAVDWKDVALSDGRVLRVATAKIKLPNADDPDELSVDVFPDGVKPDITLEVDSKGEREAVLELKSDVSLTSSLEPAEMKKGMTEADLVKAHRGRLTDPVVGSGSERQKVGEKQVVDVVLQRAVDVLKGIRMLSSWR
jgi:C-terminal processing protease CtpA/Prc